MLAPGSEEVQDSFDFPEMFELNVKQLQYVALPIDVK